MRWPFRRSPQKMQKFDWWAPPPTLGRSLFWTAVGLACAVVVLLGLGLARQMHAARDREDTFRAEALQARAVNVSAMVDRLLVDLRGFATDPVVAALFNVTVGTGDVPRLNDTLNQARVLRGDEALYLVDTDGRLRFRSIGAPDFDRAGYATFLQNRPNNPTAAFWATLPLGEGRFWLAAAAPIFLKTDTGRQHGGFVVAVPDLHRLGLGDGADAAWIVHPVTADEAFVYTANAPEGRRVAWAADGPATARVAGLPMVLANLGAVRLATEKAGNGATAELLVREGVPFALLALLAVGGMLMVVQRLRRREENLLAAQLDPRFALTLNDTLIDTAPVGLVVLNELDRVTRINRRACTLFNAEPEDFENKPVGLMFADGRRPRDNAEDTVACRTPRGVVFDVYVRQEFIGKTAARLLWLREASGDEESKAIRHLHQRSLAFLNVASAWQWEMDEQGRFVWLSEEAATALRQPREGLMYRAAAELVVPADLQRFTKQIMAAFSERRMFQDIMFRLPVPGGDLVEFLLSGEPVSEQTEFRGFRGIARVPDSVAADPITPLAPEGVQPLTGRDLKTGLWTPSALMGSLERYMNKAKQASEPAFLAQFLVRDPGDPLMASVHDTRLVRVAEALGPALKPTEVAATLEGGRLVVFSLAIQGRERVERLMALRKLVQGVLAKDKILPSTGLLLLPRDASAAEEALMKVGMAADAALNDGGERLRLYDASLSTGVLITDPTLHHIRQALSEGALELYFQPIVPMGKTVPVAFESFPYLTTKDGNVLRPAGYLPLLEAGGAMGAMDQLMMQRLFQRARTAMEDHPELAFSLNLSAATVLSPDGVALIETLSRTNRVPPNQVILEVAEGVLLADPSRARIFLRGVRRLGFRVALDRFGGGLSALGLLRSMEVDFIKIDVGLIRELDASPTAEAILKTIATTAQSQGVAVVACGIESAEAYEKLRAAGMDFAQGYYLGRPMRNRIDLPLN